MPDDRNSDPSQNNPPKDAAKSPSSAPAVPTSHPNEPHSAFVKECPNEEEKKWGHNPDTWMVILTGLLMAIGIVTAIVFYRQFKEMKAQTKILNDQAGQAAEDALSVREQSAQQIQIAKDQFRLDQRPIIWLSNIQNNIIFQIAQVVPPTGPKQIVVTVHYTNFGKSPAIKMFHSHVIAIGSKASSRIKPGPIGQIVGLVPPGKDDFFSAVSDPIKDSDIPNILKDFYIAVWARFKYQDSIGTLYQSDFCMTHLQTNAWAYCPQGNIVKDCSKETCEP